MSHIQRRGEEEVSVVEQEVAAASTSGGASSLGPLQHVLHILEKKNNINYTYVHIVTDFIGIRSWHDKGLNHTGEKPPPRSGGKPPGPSRLLRTSTTPPLWPCHPRGERQVGALGVLARWLRSLQMVPGLKYQAVYSAGVFSFLLRLWPVKENIVIV